LYIVGIEDMVSQAVMSRISRITAWLNELLLEIYQVSSTLFRLMIPILILVKVLEELGGVDYLGRLLGPLMSLVGLPEAMGLVWAASILVNIYGGMIIFFTQSQEVTLTVAQVTTLGGMMLVAHALPVEARIAQKAGVRLGVTLIMRLLGGLLLGWILHLLYSAGGWLQEPNQLFWRPAAGDQGLQGWLFTQLESLAAVLLIISALLTLLRLLRMAGIERLLIWLLQPLLRLLGIGSSATTITIVGMTLGLAFGGGLLIREAKAGHVHYRDVFTSMTLLAFCHSLIEDTLLVMLLGAHVSGVLWVRLLLGLLIVSLVSRLMVRLHEDFHRRYLVYSTDSG
jgi:hypothetical protein